MDQHGSRSVRRRRGRPVAIAVAIAALAAACSWVPFDFDGDKKADVAWVDPEGAWWRSGQATPLLQPPVIASPYANVDRPTFQSYSTVPGDYDGDKEADLALYDPTSATWTIRDSSTGTVRTVVAGHSGDVPVPADYDGDGKAEPAGWGPLDDTWRIPGRADLVLTDLPPPGTGLGFWPAPANHDGNPGDEPAELDTTGGHWWISGQPRVDLGSTSTWRLPAAARAAVVRSSMRMVFIAHACGPGAPPKPAFCT